MAIAVNFIGLFQKEDSAISPELTGDDLRTYSAALKMLEKEFKRGPSIAETVALKQSSA